MKKLTFVVVLFLVNINNLTFSQTLDMQIKFSDKTQMSDNCSVYYLDAGFNQRLIAGYDERKKEFQFILLDENAKVLKTNKVYVKGRFDKKAYIHGSHLKKVKDKIYLFVKIEKGKLSDFIVQEFSIEQLDFVGAPIVLLENMDKSMEFVTQSADLSKFLISTSLKPSGSKDQQLNQIGLYVFDEKFNKGLNGLYTVPYDDIARYQLSNTGVVYTSRAINDKGDSDIHNFHFEILAFEDKKSAIKAYTILSGSYIVYSYPGPKVIVNADNSCSIAFFCQKERGGNEGIVFINISNDTRKDAVFNIKDYYTEIPNNIRMRNVKPIDDKVYALKFSNDYDFISMPDGSSKIVCLSKEPAKGFHKGRTNGNVPMEYPISFSGIYTLSFDKKSKSEWIKKVPTNNIGFDDGFFSKYSKKVINKGNDLLVFYEDVVKNKNLSSSETPVEFEPSVSKNDDGHIFCTKTNAIGTVETYDLGSKINTDNHILISSTELIGNALVSSLLRNLFQKNTLVFYEVLIK